MNFSLIDYFVKIFFFIIGGPDTKNLNTSRIPVYTTHGPSGTSVKNMVHFMQCGRSNQFQADNTAIFWAGKDWLADPVDVTYV